MFRSLLSGRIFLLALGSLVSASCGVSTLTVEEPLGSDDVLSPPSGDVALHDSLLATSGRQIVYVNFDGPFITHTDVFPYSDAAANTSYAMMAEFGISAYDFAPYADPGGRQYVIDHLRSIYAPYNVEFTTTRPAVSPYSMLVVSPSPVGSKWGIASQMDCDNLVPNDVAFVYGHGTDNWDRTFRASAHEIGHLFGLTHAANAYDVMAWNSSGSDFKVSNWDSSFPLKCFDGNVQDGPALLAQSLGLRHEGGPSTPSVEDSDSAVSLRTASTGGLVAFVTGTDGALWHRWQVAPGGGWLDWVSLGGNLTSPPTIATTHHGAFAAFALGTDGALWHKWQVAPGGGWSDWVSLGGNLSSRPAVASTPGGALAVFALGADGALLHKWQTSAGGSWTDWVSLGGALSSGPVVRTLDHGGFVVFARSADSTLWHNWQTGPGEGWHGWFSLGGSFTSTPTLTTTLNGAFVAFARGTDGAVWHTWQSNPGSSWSSWVGLGGQIASAPEVFRHADGRFVAFARGTDNALWHTWQTSPGGNWSGWFSLGGSISSAPVVRLASTGGLVAFARGTDGALWHTWQFAPGSNWSGWVSLGASIRNH